MAYNDDQAEIDAMSSMSTSSVRSAPASISAYDPALRNQIGILSRAIDGLSRKLDTVSEVSGVKGNHMPERIATAIGGPIGLSVVSAFKQLNLGDQISEKVGGIFSRLRNSKPETNGGFLNPASMSKINFQSATMITDTLKSEVSRPLVAANVLAKQQQEITKRGNIAVVKSIGQLNETIANKLTAEQVKELRRANNQLIATIQQSNQKAIAEQRYKSSQSNETTTNINDENDFSSITAMLEKISEQLDSFQDPNGAKGGIFRMLADFALFRIRGAFYGKYSRQIPRSNNPLQTIADASLKMYEWQRLYGELTKEQLNELIRKLGGTEKKVVGRKGAIWEWMTNNPQSWQIMKSMLGNSDTVSGKLVSWLMKGYEWNSQWDEETWADNILSSVKKSSNNRGPVTGIKDFYNRIVGGGDFDVEKMPDSISNMPSGPQKDAAIAKWQAENRVETEKLRRRLFNTWTDKTPKHKTSIYTQGDTYYTPNSGPAITPVIPNPIYNDQLDGVIAGTIPVTIMGGAPIDKLVKSSQHTATYTQKIFDDDQGDEREASAEARYNKYKKKQGGGGGSGQGGGKDSNSATEEGKSWLRTLATYTPALATAAGGLFAWALNNKFNPVNSDDVNDATKLASNTAATREGMKVGYKAGEYLRKGANKAFAKATGKITKSIDKLPKALRIATKPVTATMTAARGTAKAVGYLGKGAAWTTKKVLTPVASGIYAYDAYSRFNDDQDIRALASGANSALMWVPGVGWITSVGLDTATSMGDRTQAELQRNGILELEARNAGDTVTANATRTGYLTATMVKPYVSDMVTKGINIAGTKIADKVIQSSLSGVPGKGKLLNKSIDKLGNLGLKMMDLGKNTVTATAGKSMAKVGLKTVGKMAGGVTAAMDISDSVKRFKQGDTFGGSMAALSATSTLGAMGAMAVGGKIGAWGGPIGIAAGALAGGLIVLNDIKRSTRHMKYYDDTQWALSDPQFLCGKDNKKILDVLNDKDLDSYNKTKKISEMWHEFRRKNCISEDPTEEMNMLIANDMFRNSPAFSEYIAESKQELAELGLDPNKPQALWTAFYRQWKENKLKTIDQNHVNDIVEIAGADSGFQEDHKSQEAMKLIEAARKRGAIDDNQYKGEIYWLYHDYADRARKFNYKTGKYEDSYYSGIYNLMNDYHGLDSTLQIESNERLRQLSKKGNTEAASILNARKNKNTYIGHSIWTGRLTKKQDQYIRNLEYAGYDINEYVPAEAIKQYQDGSWMTQEDKKNLKDTDTLRATNKVYSQQQAMKPLVKEVKEGTQKQIQAVNNNSAAVTNSIKTVNTTIINNNSKSSIDDVPYYQAVTGTSGENL